MLSCEMKWLGKIKAFFLHVVYYVYHTQKMPIGFLPVRRVGRNQA